nr:hypothetical protein [uncultured Rhodopila sp.]
MSTHDLTDVVATLTFPIVTEIGLADAPASEAAMHDQVSAWFADGDDDRPATQDRPVEGMGLGLELLTSPEAQRLVVEALLGASIHLGLVEMTETVRQRLWRRKVRVPQIDALIAQAGALQDELRGVLLKIGLEPEDAERVAVSAVSALAAKTQKASEPNAAKPSPEA